MTNYYMTGYVYNAKFHHNSISPNQLDVIRGVIFPEIRADLWPNIPANVALNLPVVYAGMRYNTAKLAVEVMKAMGLWWFMAPSWANTGYWNTGFIYPNDLTVNTYHGKTSLECDVEIITQIGLGSMINNQVNFMSWRVPEGSLSVIKELDTMIAYVSNIWRVELFPPRFYSW